MLAHNISTKPYTKLDAYIQKQKLLKLAKVALKDYGLENAEVQLIAHRQSTTYRIKVRGKIQKLEANSPYLTNCYLLKIHGRNYLSPQSVASELQWLQALRQETALPVPGVVPTLKGDYVTVASTSSIPEPRVCSLTRWVHGELGKPMKLKSIGRLMARIHAHGQQWQPPSNFIRPRWDWRGLFGEGAGYSINNGAKIWQLTPEPYRQIFQQVGDRVKQMMEILGEDENQFGLIHGQMCPRNLLTFGNEIRPIDFANCGYGYWMQDIAMFISYFARDPRVPKYLRLLVEGYREIKPLPSKQLVYIDTFITLHQVTLALWKVNRAQNWGDRSVLANLQETAQQAQWFLSRCPFPSKIQLNIPIR